MKTKYIFVTGGVMSGLGKGITASSLGKLLKSKGLKVTIQKFDPYINIDPGTMSPYQHGEVFVTDDGAETDLDIGHYERFIDENLNKFSNVTAGRIYQSVINKEREGKYLGETVQVIPHITNEIKENIYRAQETSNADIIITEIGGTVGDIESLPFLEATRQVRRELGYENTLFIHVTLIPFISSSEEIKTKPTQHSVKELMQIGIVPDIIVCRTNKHLMDEHRSKIALFCNILKSNVFENYDAQSIYEVPLMLESQGISKVVCKHLNIKESPINLTSWNDLVRKQKEINLRENKVTVALVGKYVAMKDAYMSYIEALNHASIANNIKVEIKWIQAENLESENVDEDLSGCSGIIVAGGFGERGVSGKINAIKFARENKIPFLGVCLGMQLMAIEFARNVLGLEGADSLEFNENTTHPIVTIMEEQKKHILKGGTMRLGKFSCVLKKDSLAYKAYDNKEIISERHRHRFEFNTDYKDQMEEKGFEITGTLENSTIVEIAEIKNHPYMIGVQFHPELKSRITRPHPLFVGLVQAMKNIKK